MAFEKGTEIGTDGKFICTSFPTVVFNSANYASKYIFGVSGYESEIAKALRTGSSFKGYEFAYVEYELEAENSYIFDL